MGVIVAHVAAFFVAEPHSHARDELLAATGHRYWAVTIAAALALLVASMATLVWNRVRAANPASAGEMFVEAAPRLALVQVLGFVLLEGVERITVGHGLLDLFAEPVVVIGIVAQIVVALLGAAVVALLTRLVDAVVASIRSGVARAPRVLSLPPEIPFIPSNLHLALGGLTLRGPPLLPATR